MENFLTIGERLIFSIMGLASILALAVSIEKGLLFSHTAKSGNILLPKIKEHLRTKKTDDLGG